MPELEPDGREVEVGNVTLRTPGLRGVAESFEPSLDGLRGPEGVDDSVVELMQELGLERLQTIQISQAMEEPAAEATPRRSPYGEPAIEVDVPSPNEEFEQVVLYTDESGVTTWNFARDANDAQDVTRGGAPRTYVLRRFVPPTGEGLDGATRGALGSLGSKLIRVLAFRIVDPVVGGLADTFVDRWEASKHPYRLRTFTVDDRATAGTTLERPDLDFFRAGRALLMIHGTGSNTQEGLGGIDETALAALHQLYEGRVLAFDHPTIGTAPRENAIELLLQLDGQGWDLDIVSHSRGGLVARMLIEQASALGEMPDKLQVRRVVFAGVPNAGTPLADAQHLQAFVDTYTTMLNVLGAGIPVVATLGSIVAVVKQVAASALKGLDGLQSMNPGGPFLANLNSGPAGPEAYFALASNYEPPAGSGLATFRDAVTDAVFDGKPNDLVVPTLGVFDLGAAFSSGRFPVVEPRLLKFEPAASLDHSAFFKSPDGAAQIVAWLSQT
jgi:hypothetical protein